MCLPLSLAAQSLPTVSFSSPVSSGARGTTIAIFLTFSSAPESRIELDFAQGGTARAADVYVSPQPIKLTAAGALG